MNFVLHWSTFPRLNGFRTPMEYIPTTTSYANFVLYNSTIIVGMVRGSTPLEYGIQEALA